MPNATPKMSFLLLGELSKYDQKMAASLTQRDAPLLDLPAIDRVPRSQGFRRGQWFSGRAEIDALVSELCGLTSHEGLSHQHFL